MSEQAVLEIARALARSNSARTSRVFAALMLGQWLFGIAIALAWSPYAWAGRVRSVHLHVYLAVFLGAALSSLPLFLIWKSPTATATRHVVAAAQMLWSALLIHLSGGRIETHFHVFGSLAFLAFYRDWRVLVTATAVVAGDHLLRGLLWPESVYGIANPEWWRFAEHALWVVFEDVVLVLACLRGVEETSLIAQRQAEADQSLARVTELNQALDQRVQQLQQSLEKQREMHVQLLKASRLSGMAEVATAVLHNVGNVLNSVNVAAGVLCERLARSKISGLGSLAAMLSRGELSRSLEEHPKGRQVTAYVVKLNEALGEEREAMLRELQGLQRNVEHIKEIVSTQQSNSRAGGVLELLSLQELIADAVRMSVVTRDHRQPMEVVRELEDLPPLLVDRHKVLQIVMNLLSNARHAICDGKRGEGRITLRLQRAGEDRVRLEVEDTGVGIAPENLTRVFTHGFTTKPTGHGFGLHSSACAAMEMGGTLGCRSDGPGRGATFTLELPVRVARDAAA